MTSNNSSSQAKISSWFKRSFSKSNIGELLSNTGKFYREIKEENETLWRRTEEVEAAMTTKSGTPRLAAHLEGKPNLNSKYVLHAGTSHSGILLGTADDEKLLSISWYRQPESSVDWELIAGASGGIFHPTPDELGCKLRAEVTFTRQFRLFSPSLLTDAIIYAYPLCREERISLEDEIKLDLNSMVNSKHAKFVELCDIFDPGKDVTLEVSIVDSKMNVIIRKGGTEDVKSICFPNDIIQIQIIHESSRQFNLVMKNSDGSFEKLHLGSKTREMRTVIVLCLRAFRNMISQKLNRNYDYFELAKTHSETRRISRSLSEFSISSALSSLKSLGTGRKVQCRCIKSGKGAEFVLLSVDNELFCACMSVYPDVGELIGFSISEPGEFNRSNSEQTSQFRSSIQSVHSIISTAFDPFAMQVKRGTSAKNHSRNVYDLANFGERFDVPLDLAEGEGLGITLGVFEVTDSFSVVCLTGFVPIGEQGIKGQLENSEKVEIGDALIAINGKEVAPLPNQQGTLQKVVDLMNEARCGVTSSAHHGFNDIATSSKKTLINAAASITITFAKAGKTAPTEETQQPESYEREESKIKMMKETIEELNEQINALNCTQAILENRISEQTQRADKYCKMMESIKETASKHKEEHYLLSTERAGLSSELAKSKEYYEGELSSLKEQVIRAQDTANYWREEAEKIGKDIVHKEASMQALAMDGEAFTNTLETKERALRALEGDMRVLKVRNENLQNLLDSSREERNKIEIQVEDLDKENQSLQDRLARANDEADRLIAKLRSEKERSEEAESRKVHELSLLTNELREVKMHLASSQTYTKALKDSVTTLETRAKSLQLARQEAEEAKSLLQNRCDELEKDLDKARNSTQPAYIKNNHSKMDNEHTENEQISRLKATIEELRLEKREHDSMVLHLQQSNDDLRAQVKALKAKSQSMSNELSRLVKLDKLEALANELTVKLKLAEASKMEAEDELVAYKRALAQFAEQAKIDEMNGNGTPWTNRPKIFDHLYKKDVKAKQRRGKLGF